MKAIHMTEDLQGKTKVLLWIKMLMGNIIYQFELRSYKSHLLEFKPIKTLIF